MGPAGLYTDLEGECDDEGKDCVGPAGLNTARDLLDSILALRVNVMMRVKTAWDLLDSILTLRVNVMMRVKTAWDQLDSIPPGTCWTLYWP